MTTQRAADATTRSVRADARSLDVSNIERALRLWAGFVLMVFLTMHLTNHALGIFGVDAMRAMQVWRVWMWRSPIGTWLLYGALLVHVVIALKRVLTRRTLKMPMAEAVQILLGIAIPVMLWRHLVDTRIVHSLAGVDTRYVNMLRYLWPDNALWQSAATLVAWAHGVMGLHFVLRTKSWFAPYRTAFFIVACLLPVLSLAGFVAGGRESHTLAAPPEDWDEHQIAVHQAAMMYARMIVWGALGAVAAFLIGRAGFRHLRPSVAVRYVGHGATRSPIGLTLLEMSRLNQIPHPSVCGGRGRCSTCRVLVLSDQEHLPPPNAIEKRLLDRIRAPDRVRLACQIRPVKDLSVKILLPVDKEGRILDSDDHKYNWGAGRDVTVLFADIRGFSILARSQLPEDIIILLNRVIEDMTQAVVAHSGRLALVMTDGIMAVFGAESFARSQSRAALEAAVDMLKATETVNREMRGAMPQPLRIGIGIHNGHAVVARIGDDENGYSMSVIGETVSIASRLEEATKELAADCVVSESVLAAAGVKVEVGSKRTLHYKNGDEPVAVRALADRGELESLLRRSARAAEREHGPEPAPAK